MCAVVGVYRRPKFGTDSVLSTVLSMLHRQDNRGDDGWGLSALHANGAFKVRLSQISADSDPVLLNAEKTLEGNFNSPAILGHVRYATSGEIVEKNSQPVQNDPKGILPLRQRVSLAFNGNIANVDELRSELQGELKSEGFTDLANDLDKANDTQVLMRLIEQITRRQMASGRERPDYAEIFRELDQRIDGACSLVLLDGAGDMVSYRNSLGIRPLWFAETDDGLLCTASETNAFKGLRIKGKPLEVPPGEIIWYDRSRDQYEHKFVGDPDLEACANECTRPTKLCIFESLYLQSPASEICGQENYETRRKIGRAAADVIAPTIRKLSRQARRNVRIMAVPNTGIAYTEGIAQRLHELWRGPLSFLRLIRSVAPSVGIQRNPVPRTFLSDEKKRRERLEKKYTIIGGNVKGKSIWLCDDTLVRSATSEILTRQMYENGAKEVNWVICAPPIIGRNDYGISIPSLEELAFWKIWKQSTSEERERLYPANDNWRHEMDLKLLGEKMAASIKENLGLPADFKVTVTYLPLDKLKGALPGSPDQYDFSCLDPNQHPDGSGGYPTPAGQRLFDDNLRKLVAA